jgi:molybdate transport system ATP-binding protein
VSDLVVAGAGLDVAMHVRVGAFDLECTFSAGTDDVVAVLGPNGAGKTTLLRALAGLLAIDEGSIVLDGVVLDAPASGTFVLPEERPVGYVFQEYLLFPHLSARENVAFGLRSRGIPKREARAAADEWLGRVGLADRGRSKPKQLSGGQAQRVALARALALNPRLLLLDEPLAALDAGARAEVRRELRRHLASFDGVRLLVTHDPVDALALANRLLVFEDGRLVQDGTIEEVTARPRSRYVADLVGVNLFRGVASGTRVDVAGGEHLVVADAGQGAVFAMVHPNAVALYRNLPAGSPRNVWAGRVESIDLLGDRVRVRVGGPLPLVAEVTPGAVRDLELDEGVDVWAAVKATEVVVYAA